MLVSMLLVLLWRIGTTICHFGVRDGATGTRFGCGNPCVGGWFITALWCSRIAVISIAFASFLGLGSFWKISSRAFRGNVDIISGTGVAAGHLA